MSISGKSFFLAGCFAVAQASHARDLPPMPVDSFLEKHCFECHDDAVSKGQLNLLELSFDLSDPAVFERWELIHHRVKTGEMPPEKKPRPDATAMKRFLSELETPMLRTDREEIAKNGRVSSRRMTRSQYENTIHDLLGVDIPLVDHLPEPAPMHHFENVAKFQLLSHHHLGRYLETAEMALEEAFGRVFDGEPSFRRSLNARELGRGSWRGSNYRGPEDKNGRAIAWPIQIQFYGRMPATRVPESGWYRIRLKDVEAVNAEVVWGTLNSGAGFSNAPVLYSIGTIEATREKRDLVFEAWIREDHLLEMKPADATLPRAKVRTRGGTVIYEGSDPEADGTPGIAITGIELTRIYPHASREEVERRLLGPANREEMSNGKKQRDTEWIAPVIHDFARRAFRRPLSREQAEPYVELARQVLAEEGSGPREALFTAYRAILCSPRFLTFVEKPGRLDDHAIASRLSYLLWDTAPDSKLLALAKSGELKGKNLRREADRLLSDPRSDRFVARFTDQWLDLAKIDFTSPDQRRFRTFDPVVQESMVSETRAFVGELFHKNLSVSHFVRSDFSMLNERMVRFYGLEHTEVQPGAGLQRVSLTGPVRGGLVTQGSILKVTADGTTTSPILRGVYLGERILGRHIPPPPPGVPAVEPDIRGAVSIRDQLAKHRNSENCAACHKLIDPPGFALENFDPVGLWRERYGSSKDSVTVDPSGVTPDGQAFRGIADWKELHADRPEELARAFAEQLLTYAIGSEPRFSDRAAVDKIVADAAARDYGVRSILHAVIQSPPFLTK